MADINTNIVLTNVRIIFPQVFEPKKVNNDDPNEKAKYSVVALIRKDDLANVQKIDTVIQQLIASRQDLFKGIPDPKNTKQDGDLPRSGGTMWGEECRGCWVMNLKSSRKPGLVDENLQPIMDRDAIYSGVYANLAISGFAYKRPTSRGISFGLNHVMSLGIGERLAGGVSVEEAFAGLAGTGAATTGENPGMATNTPVNTAPVNTAPAGTEVPWQAGTAVTAGVPRLDPMTGLPYQIDPMTSQPYQIDPMTGQPIT